MKSFFRMAKNPLKQYFNGEFPEQYQEPPGLQKEMSPLPDCGETRLLMPAKVQTLRSTTCLWNSRMQKKLKS